MARKKKVEEGFSTIGMKGMFRVQIESDNGEITGDSGWVKNTITNAGLQYFISRVFLKSAGSSQISCIGLGCSQNNTASNWTANTAMGSEISGSTVKTTGSTAYTSRPASGSADIVQWTGTFTSSPTFLGAASTIANIALFGETASTATAFAIGTFATSQCSTNQNVNFTYQVQFTGT
jgi:hypothetical protein